MRQVLLPLLAMVLALPAQEPAQAPREEDRYLDAAAGCARYMLSLAGEDGLWPVSDRAGRPVSFTLYGGVPAGILLLELLEEAGGKLPEGVTERAVASLLAASHEHEAGGPTWQLTGTPESSASGLYVGDAGIAWLLMELAERGRSDLREQAQSTLRGLIDRGVKDGDGLHWNAGTDIISGTAGTGLVLLEAATRLEMPQAAAAAAAAGRWLVRQGIADGEGLKWKIDAQHERVYPNFSHGTAGVAFFLLELHAATKTASFLEAAKKGLTYLEREIQRSEAGSSWYHHEGDGRELFYVSFCHGPPGTARFYEELHRATGEARWRRRVLECGAWVAASGIPKPEEPIAGFWNESTCCGSAGVGDFYLDLYATTEERRWLEAARSIADHLLASARQQGETLSWSGAEHRVRPGDLEAQTGWAQGTAGTGLFFLRLHVALTNPAAPRWRLPDTPFPCAP